MMGAELGLGVVDVADGVALGFADGVVELGAAEVALPSIPATV